MAETIAGQGSAGHKDGIGGEAKFKNPSDIVISRDGKELYVADLGNSCIRKVSILEGNTSTVAGKPGKIRVSLSALSSKYIGIIF